MVFRRRADPVLQMIRFVLFTWVNRSHVPCVPCARAQDAARALRVLPGDWLVVQGVLHMLASALCQWGR
jgi:hypothetical protein